MSENFDSKRQQSIEQRNGEVGKSETSGKGSNKSTQSAVTQVANWLANGGQSDSSKS